MKIRNPILTNVAGMAALVILLLVALPAALHAAGGQQFDSPEDAVAALKQAAASRDTNAVRAVFGPDIHQLMNPDAVQAHENFDKFVDRIGEKTQLVPESDSKQVLELGNERYPFAIPLVKENGKWFFDVDAGKEEILNRRIGANELGALGVVRAYVDAQREYASQDHSGQGVLQYAQHLRSAKGMHDGLYWSVTNDYEQLSPFGPLITEAKAEGYHRHSGMMTEENTQTPYHGYYFKILTRQGSHAPGGKYDYIINGNMIAGFALLAWPAEYGNTGIMTFIVNQQGKIYQKDLGPKTESIAGRITTYDPDSSWKLVSGH